MKIYLNKNNSKRIKGSLISSLQKKEGKYLLQELKKIRAPVSRQKRKILRSECVQISEHDKRNKSKLTCRPSIK